MHYLRDRHGAPAPAQGGNDIVTGQDPQNPAGLIMLDGYCMCPLVESGPPGLSPTFCYCSTGYVKEIFERTTGKPVTVDLIESLKMGGKDCVFGITIHDV